MSSEVGRPPHEPTPESRKTVEGMVAVGMNQEDVAKVVGIDAKTLRAHYRDELDVGKVKALAQVAAGLFKRAKGDGQVANTAAIFILKCQGGWKETTVVETVGLSHEEALELMRNPPDLVEDDAIDDDFERGARVPSPARD